MAQTHRQVSANISEEIYQRGKITGIRWGKLIENGVEMLPICAELRAQLHVAYEQIRQLQAARDKLQRALLRDSEMEST